MAMPNNSLDASGTSGLVIDNLSVIQLTAAASTQPLGAYCMLKTLALSSIILMSAIAVGQCSLGLAQEKDICPIIVVDCPDNVLDGNSDLVFQGHVGAALTKVTYHWTVHWVRGVPKGRIKSGQGTTSLVVSASGRARHGMTVTFIVKGLDKSCGNQAFCTMPIAMVR